MDVKKTSLETAKRALALYLRASWSRKRLIAAIALERYNASQDCLDYLAWFEILERQHEENELAKIGA
jgi:hypothetical protein